MFLRLKVAFNKEQKKAAIYLTSLFLCVFDPYWGNWNWQASIYGLVLKMENGFL